MHGLDFLAEDSVLVRPDGLLATGVANFLHVRPDSLRFLEDAGNLADIRRSCVIRRRSGVEKFEIDLRHRGTGWLRRRCGSAQWYSSRPDEPAPAAAGADDQGPTDSATRREPAVRRQSARMDGLHPTGIPLACVRAAQGSPPASGGRSSGKIVASSPGAGPRQAREAVKIAIIVPGGVDVPGNTGSFPCFWH